MQADKTTHAHPVPGPTAASFQEGAAGLGWGKVEQGKPIRTQTHKAQSARHLHHLVSS